MVERQRRRAMHYIKRILVTGAAGTVGGFIVGHLLQKGYEVTATDLSFDQMMDDHFDYWCKCASKYTYFPNSKPGPLGLVDGDLTYPLFIKQLIANEKIDAVIHAAALIDVALPYEALEPANVTAALNLYRELAKIGGKKFVFLSSGSIYADAPLLTEDTPFQPNSPYEQTKVDAEKLLQKEYAANPGDPELAILRPSLIYGPKNKFLAANYLAIAIILSELLGKRMPRTFTGPKTNLVHAEDVACAAIFLMENESTHTPGNNAYNICDDSVFGFGDHLLAMANACGAKTVRLPIPLPPAKLIGLLKPIYNSPIFLKMLNAILQGMWQAIAKKYKLENGFTPDISPAMTPFFGQDTVFSNEKIKSLGFTLLHPDFREGIKTVIPWYKQHRWIP